MHWRATLVDPLEVDPACPAALSCFLRISCKDHSVFQMANHFSALKRVRQDEKRTEFNRQSRTRLRHQIRAIRRAISSKDGKAAAELLPGTFSIIDRSAKTGIIKKNTAARYKANLHLQVKALATA